jgi:GalNAc-alpha-(1->4)-GalNAc-alpha-(1->3)-diNAcBac-PP-undecaprenol alpha-1,4-N-acetyl-D-galactosaminyltransferase
MRVVLAIPTLGPGGAERVMTLLAASLAARGHEVSLLTLGPTGEDFFAVDARVQRIGLGLMSHSASILQALRANAQRVRALRHAILEISPDAVLSFMTSMNVLSLFACSGVRTRVVVSERIDPKSHRESRIWRALRNMVYRRADAIVVQTESAAQWFRASLGKHAPVIVVPNPVATAVSSLQSNIKIANPFILAAGRLEQQKGFDVLIRAFALVVEECSSLCLAIAGEGPQAQALRALVAELRLDSRVTFLGTVSGLQALMRKADAFVLSSRYEGFPNVLLEALACGLPVVATDCPGGPREILNNGEFGLLVPCEDPSALAGALRRVFTEVGLRDRLSAVAPLATAKYAVERVMPRWEELLVSNAVPG